MPKYVIEREIPGVGALSTAELRSISQKSCNVLRGMGTDVTVGGEFRHWR
jgi:predicted small secreted protein